MGKAIQLLFFLSLTITYSQGSYSFNKAENEKKFYYPKMHDKFWRTYQPNLIGAEGWIKENCRKKGLSGKEVTVLFELIEHYGWGNYKGNLIVKIKGNSKEIKVDVKCFDPNYEKGDWLGPNLEIPNWKEN
ncbi:hypothetical protein [Aquimarina aggregata]|uniref:hypothetical protein n=1 Tax=Aquimarina aggregata TaxID=1642818 RepID=UPI00249336D9|nr:hypothetical protein [Aquimarina aggregata]